MQNQNEFNPQVIQARLTQKVSELRARLQQNDLTLTEINLWTITPIITPLSEGLVESLVSDLRENKTVVSLKLYVSKLSDRTATVIASILQANSSLQTLEITKSGGGLTSIGIQALADALVVNTSLKHLTLPCNTSIEPLMATLIVNKTLETLNFDDDPQIAEADKKIEIALQSTTSLKSLFLTSQNKDISWCPIFNGLALNTSIETFAIHNIKRMYYDEEKLLLRTLENNKTLKSLTFNNTQFDENIILKILRIIAQNKRIEELSIESNEFTDTCAMKLASVLLNNDVLKKIDLFASPITDLGACALAHMLTKNQTLQELAIAESDIGEAGTKALAKAHQKNFTLEDLCVNSIDWEELSKSSSYLGNQKKIEQTSARNKKAPVMLSLLMAIRNFTAINRSCKILLPEIIIRIFTYIEPDLPVEEISKVVFYSKQNPQLPTRHHFFTSMLLNTNKRKFEEEGDLNPESAKKVHL